MKKVLITALLSISMMTSVLAQDMDSKYACDLLQVGTVAPNLINDEGQVVSLEKYRGRCVVLDFWASWCPDCRKDMPKMMELYSQYDIQGIEFIGVSFDDNREALDNYLKKESIHWQQVCELKKMKDAQMAKDYHIKWIPTMYLLDTEGKVALATVEIDKLKSKLEQLKKSDQLVIPAMKGQDHLPEYKGGISGLMKFLSSNMKYPKLAERYCIEGRILVKFVVEKDGRVENIAIDKATITDRWSLPQFANFTKLQKDALREECQDLLEEEAKRVVRKMPNWKPAKRRGEPARVKFTLPITFKIP